jgi:hypothetical protein
MTMRNVAGTITSLIILTVPLSGNAGAQVQGSIDAGSGALRVSGQSPSGIMLLAPSIRILTASLQLNADAHYAGLSEGGWQTSGLIASTLLRHWKQLQVGVGVTGGWSRVAWGRAAGGMMGAARLGLGNDRNGVEARAGAGSSFTTDGAQALSLVEAGGWRTLGGFHFGFRLRRTGLKVAGESADNNDAPPLEDSLPTSNPQTRRLLQDHYTDTEATIGWHHRDLELDGGIGRRFGKLAARYTSWHLNGLYWFSSRLALVGSMGRFPADVVTGMPSGSFATISMRVNLRDIHQPVVSIAKRSRRGGANFRTTLDTPGHYLISILAPNAGRVEVMGSFSQWQAVELDQAEQGWWESSLALAPGVHEINVRYDGGPWQVPVGLRSTNDDFGGLVGVFTIE